MAFKNRIRLPIKLTRPQFPEERKSFRKANGVTKTLSVVVRKEYEGETDFLPEGWHEKLKIALAHDNIRIEGDKYLGDIAQSGDYSIEWPEFLDYPTGKAKFKADVTPFSETNSNCMTCEEATQLTLEDDTITGIYSYLQEGQTYEQDLTANDTICCYPATFSVFWYNTDYITAASISETGILSVTLGTGLISANSLKIATYRVTCPNGGYDEADVYADIEGSIEGCLAPTELTSFQHPNSLDFSWLNPFLYATIEWEIYLGTLPVGSPIQSGTAEEAGEQLVEDLEAGEDYYFRIRTVCEGSESNWVGIQVATTPLSANCGEYNVAVDDGTGNPGNFYTVTYTNCAGASQNAAIPNGISVLICALQGAPGSPVSIVCAHSIITYIGEC